MQQAVAAALPHLHCCQPAASPQQHANSSQLEGAVQAGHSLNAALQVHQRQVWLACQVLQHQPLQGLHCLIP
jgi:hypothetical protein